jgi:hypothetical protein
MARLLPLSGFLMLSLLHAPSVAQAQARGELTLYSEIGFRGQTYTMNGPREFITIPFTVRSVRIAPAENWLLCDSARYDGHCNRVDRNVANISWVVRSGRPVTGAVTLPAPIPSGRQSLRGMAAEFFPAPANATGRVPSCTSGGADCTARLASRFCQSRGWNRAAYSRQQTVSKRVYLADVLCVRA